MKKDRPSYSLHESQVKFCRWCDAQATHRVYVPIINDITKAMLCCWNCARECENEHGWAAELLPIGNEDEDK